MKVTTVSIQEIFKFDRFEPRYYYMLNKHKNVFEKTGYEILSQIATLTSGTTPNHSNEKINDTDVCFIKSADVKGLQSTTKRAVSLLKKNIKSRNVLLFKKMMY